jgi:hypothetical protein
MSMPSKANIQEMIRDYNRAAAVAQEHLGQYRDERAKTAPGRALNASDERYIQEMQGMAQLLREEPSDYPWES